VYLCVERACVCCIFKFKFKFMRLTQHGRARARARASGKRKRKFPFEGERQKKKKGANMIQTQMDVTKKVAGKRYKAHTYRRRREKKSFSSVEEEKINFIIHIPSSQSLSARELGSARTSLVSHYTDTHTHTQCFQCQPR
jgi:hypothetical protein